MKFVFTDEWVAAQAKKYGHQAPYARPAYYRLWTEDEFEVRRQQIEEWVGLIPEDRRADVIGRLKWHLGFEQLQEESGVSRQAIELSYADQFRKTITELHIGESLRQLGHRTEYSPNIDGQTPDWRAYSKDGSPFLVEVVTSTQSDLETKSDAAWERLRQRIISLQGDIAMIMRIPLVAGNPPAPDDQTQKRIAAEVQNWINTSPSESLVIDDIEFVIVKCPGLGKVDCGLGGKGSWVDAGPLRESILEKASKYKAIVEKYSYPLVVAIELDFFCGRGVDDLEDAVFGSDKVRIIQDNPDDSFQYRDSDGVFVRYPTLSAVTRAKVHEQGVGHHLIVNRIAAYPVNPSWFDQPKRA